MRPTLLILSIASIGIDAYNMRGTEDASGDQLTRELYFHRRYPTWRKDDLTVYLVEKDNKDRTKQCTDDLADELDDCVDVKIRDTSKGADWGDYVYYIDRYTDCDDALDEIEDDLGCYSGFRRYRHGGNYRRWRWNKKWSKSRRDDDDKEKSKKSEKDDKKKSRKSDTHRSHRRRGPDSSSEDSDDKYRKYRSSWSIRKRNDSSDDDRKESSSRLDSSSDDDEGSRKHNKGDEGYIGRKKSSASGDDGDKKSTRDDDDKKSTRDDDDKKSTSDDDDKKSMKDDESSDD